MSISRNAHPQSGGPGCPLSGFTPVQYGKSALPGTEAPAIYRIAQYKHDMKSGNAKPLDEKQKQTTRQRNYHKPIGDLKYNFICFLLVTMIFF